MLCRKNQAALEKRERMAWYERMLVTNKREGEKEEGRETDEGAGEGRVDKGFGRLMQPLSNDASHSANKASRQSKGAMR